MPAMVVLDYGKAPPKWRWWVRRAAWVIPLACAVWVGWHWWGDMISRHVAAWYYQRPCLTYSRPATEVVWEKDPAAAKTLLLKDPDRYREWDTGAATDVACWRNLDSVLPAYCRASFSGPILFVHERASRGPAGGTPRLVVLECYRMGDFAFFWRVIKEGTLLRLPGYPNQDSKTLPPPASPVLRIYAGQADTTDHSHFTFDFETIVGRGKVDCWLEADDSLTLVVAPVVAP